MSNNKEQIIHQTKFLGVEFYKRTRVEEHEIQINAQQNITEYPGLLAIGNEPEIKYSSLSSGHMDWGSIVRHSLELVFLDLIINEFIELTVFTDKEYFFNKLAYSDHINYYLMAKKAYKGNDYLASRIIWSVKYVEKERKEKATLANVIRHLIDGCIGTDYYNHPQKEFLENLLSTYRTKVNWLTFQNDSRLLGMYSKYEVIIEPKQKAKLIAAYGALYDISTILKEESRAFYLYSDKLYEIIKSDFHRRTSKSR